MESELLKTKVLIIDDSKVICDLLKKGLATDPEIQVVGTASDPYEAREKIISTNPDVLTLDVEMPRMDGLTFLKKLMPQHPLPVIMVSGLTKSGSKITMDALDAGAIDFVLKPGPEHSNGFDKMIAEICEKVKIASEIDVSGWKKTKESPEPCQLPKQKLERQIIAIGASTGGTEAISKIISALPKNTPGIVIVQHMPVGFTGLFAERLNKLSRLQVSEAKSGDRIAAGHVLVAPGGRHLQVFEDGPEYRVVCRDGAPVYGHRPSVDVLFRSLSRHGAAKTIAIMLTGIGTDGAEAMVKLREAGARTFAQDQKTSVVFGMPKSAFDKGGAECLVSLERIPEKIMEFLTKKDK